MIRRLGSHVRNQWMGALSLFLVLAGGTAYAVDTVGSADIIDDSVRSVDLKNNDVRGGDVLNGTLGTADVFDGSLRGQDVADNSLGGAQIAESTLGEVPNATIAGHGGYGRDSGQPAWCNPTDDLWHTCASVALTPSAPARFLVTGRFFASAHAFFEEDADGEGQCRLGSSAFGGIPGTTVGVEVVDKDGDWVTITGITDTYQPGNYSFGLDCRETAGNVTTGGAHVSAVAISPF